MLDTTKDHGRRVGAMRKGDPDELARILEALEIRVVGSGRYLEANCTRARESLRNLLALHGAEHLTLTLRAIVETEGNSQALIDPIVRAVSAVIIAHPDWAASGLRFIEAFDGLPLRHFYHAAERLQKTAAAPGWAFIAGMIAVVLRHEFEGPAKRTRAEITEARQEHEEETRAQKAEARLAQNARRIQLGRQLLELKRLIRGNNFVRFAPQHGIELRPQDPLPCDMIRVAVLYGDKPAIWKRVRWSVLHQLAYDMPDAMRSGYEARIEAGERVLAKDIMAARRAQLRQAKPPRAG